MGDENEKALAFREMPRSFSAKHVLALGLAFTAFSQGGIEK